ncbi:MAG: Holliday junction branch migration protein RuvA [Planctomycetota bacterium]
MYEYFDGVLESRGPTRVVVDVGGIGYDVAVPVGADFRPAPGSAGNGEERIRVWTHLVVREDSHRLFGFPTAEEREIFRLLLLVRGVGPGLALAILSGFRGDSLLDAIAAGDLAALTRIRGVGKKTAEQILLDLRGRAPAAAPAISPGGVTTRRGHASRAVEDAVQALTSIGYSEKEARRSVERAATEVDPADVELLVRSALRG